MNEGKLLPLDTYAQVLVHLLHRGATPVASILGRFQLSAEEFRRADAHWTDELAQSLVRRKGMLAMSFAAAFAKTHKELGLINPAAGEPNVAPNPSQSSALPSYLRNQAATAPPLAPTAQAQAISNYESQQRRDSVPFASAPTPPVAIASVSPVNIDATGEVRAISIGPALPFGGRPASIASHSGAEEPRLVPQRHAGDETAALPAIDALKAALPFGNAGAPAEPSPDAGQDLPVDPAMLTLEQYASLSAELAAMHESRPAILKRYSLENEAARTQHAIYWAKRMQKNEPLKARYNELMTTFSQHLERSRGG